MGEIEESLIFPYPELDTGTKDTLREVLGSVDTMLEKHDKDFRRWDEKGELPLHRRAPAVRHVRARDP